MRPQDLEDIIRMKPTRSDIAFLREHLHRLEAESLDRQTHEAQLAILDTLEPCHDPA
ncbi:MAG: hypothetical protein HC898_09870 [Phycisphaerales bacterium]|nr:hypothetical protein [Phycisphaerales bacterium]